MYITTYLSLVTHIILLYIYSYNDSKYISLYYILLYYITLHHTILYYATFFVVLSYESALFLLRDTALYEKLSHCTMGHYTTLREVIMCESQFVTIYKYCHKYILSSVMT